MSLKDDIRELVSDSYWKGMIMGAELCERYAKVLEDHPHARHPSPAEALRECAREMRNARSEAEKLT